MSYQGQTPQSQQRPQTPPPPLTAAQQAAQQQAVKDYRKTARALWDLNGERLKFASQIQADYGKWLIVTVATIHSAAIYAVSQSSMPEAVRVNPMSYWPFVDGIVLILIAGLLTWFNWSLLATIYGDWLNCNMLVNPSNWPKDAPKWQARALWWTWWGGLVVGILSAACVPWGAYEALHSPQLKYEQRLPAPMPKTAIAVPEPPKPVTAAPPHPAITAPATPTGLKTGAGGARDTH